MMVLKNEWKIVLLCVSLEDRLTGSTSAWDLNNRTLHSMLPIVYVESGGVKVEQKNAN